MMNGRFAGRVGVHSLRVELQNFNRGGSEIFYFNHYSKVLRSLWFSIQVDACSAVLVVIVGQIEIIIYLRKSK